MEKKIEEEYRLISEFMGWKYFMSTKYYRHPDEVSIYLINEMRWDKDWQWLMEVIDDIYYSRRFPTGAQTSELSSQPHKLYKNIEKSLLHLSIEQTYNAVIQFITWYNTQKLSHDKRI